MKKSILMLASLALLSACGKEANEPVVKQTQQEQAGDRITIALNGTIDEDMLTERPPTHLSSVRMRSLPSSASTITMRNSS